MFAFAIKCEYGASNGSQIAFTNITLLLPELKDD